MKLSVKQIEVLSVMRSHSCIIRHGWQRLFIHGNGVDITKRVTVSKLSALTLTALEKRGCIIMQRVNNRTIDILLTEKAL